MSYLLDCINCDTVITEEITAAEAGTNSEFVYCPNCFRLYKCCGEPLMDKERSGVVYFDKNRMKPSDMNDENHGGYFVHVEFGQEFRPTRLM